MILTYKYRLLPTKRQHEALKRILEEERQLYNGGLQERIDCYRKTGKALTNFDQCKELTEWRQSDEDARKLPVNLQRWTLRRLDEAFNGFFRRLRTKNGRAGLPRFRSFGRWHSFGFNEFNGITINGKRLRFKGFTGKLKISLHREFPKNSKIKSCVFHLDHKGWKVCFEVEIYCRPDRISNRQIGIDVGINHLATLSTGEHITNIKTTRHAHKELRIRQRALSRCKRNSKRRQKVRHQVTLCHTKIKNTRRTYLHQVSRKLVNSYDLIAVEKLNIKGLIQTGLSKNITDASWGILNQMLCYKAERAGARYIEVDPRYTSHDCSECGTRVPKTLSIRTHNCPNCGLILDRDVNAARNVLHRAVVSPEFVNVAQWSERGTRNISLEIS